MCFEIPVEPKSEELTLIEKWIMTNFGAEADVLPFSFNYSGQSSADLLKKWKSERVSKKLDESRTQHTLIYTDSTTGLEVRGVIVEYKDFPTVEWTLYFKNTGTSATPILSDIQALDISFDLDLAGTDADFMLHHFAGGFAQPDAYRPYQTVMGPKTNKSFSAAGGRPTNKDMSYFNLEGKGEGVIVVVGWPGQWSAQFNCDEKKIMHVVAGQELTRFTLYPGEEVRTPLIVLQFWKDRDWLDAQNVWRRWMMAHSMPKPYSNLPEPRVLGSSYRVYGEMVNANEENQIMFINRYLEENLKIDYWWMDAGWYPCEGNWGKTGTWEVDTERFPGGLRAISDYAHSKGIKTMVWFEPERVAASTWLTENHPEWVLRTPLPPLTGGLGANGGLLNLGNPEALEWLTNHVDQLLTEQGIDVYRQDFNMDPLDYWRRNDTEDRQGITEIKHVMGYLAYWDELIRRHPNMLIDTCASGGRRNDLETLRRAVPLWRTDYQYEPIGEQCQTYGISFWIPYHGGGNIADASAAYSGAGFTAVEPYAFWSTCYPSINCAIDMRVKEIDYATLRSLHNQRREIVSYYYGDFYPLTPYSLENDVWIAWQFNQPEAGEGMIQAFRRQKSDILGYQFKLRGLEPDAQYELTSFDVLEKTIMTGCELMEKGLDVYLKDCSGAAALKYKKIGPDN